MCGCGAGVIEWFSIDLTALSFNTTVLLIEVRQGSSVVSRNVQALAPPKAMQLPRANVTFTVDNVMRDDGFPIHLRTDAPALYVTLTTLEQGHFSDNAFLLTGNAVGVRRKGWGGGRQRGEQKKEGAAKGWEYACA